MYRCNECGEEVDEGMTDLIFIETKKCWKNLEIGELLEIDKMLEAFREVVKAGIIARVAQDGDLMGIARKALGDDPELLGVFEEARRMVLNGKLDSLEDDFQFPDELPIVG